MGMQSLRLKLRKRKYKLSLNGGRNSGAGGPGDSGPTAFSNAGSEWEFENFSPWIFTAAAAKSRANSAREEVAADEEDEQYWGPRPRIQGLVNNNHLPPPLSNHHALREDAEPLSTTSSRGYGILSYFPRRPSSWSPTSPAAPPLPPVSSQQPPPVPLHAWQVRRRNTPPRPDSSTATQRDLKRSASVAYQTGQVNDSQFPCRSADDRGSSSWGSRGPQVPVRLKRVQSELGSDQHLLPVRKSDPLQAIYSRPHRWRSTNEVRTDRKSSHQAPRLSHNGLKSTLASSESHLSGSYTVLTDEDLFPSIDHPLRSSLAIIERSEDDAANSSPSPPPVPPHAPGVVCTRIGSAHLPTVGAISNSFSQASPLPQRGKQR